MLLWGDSLYWLRQINDDSIHTVITSPPYYALRNYKVDGQLGLEPTYDEYIARLLTIFDEVRRVLRPDGTCWIVMSDTYNGNKKGYTYGQYGDGRKTKQQYQKGDIYEHNHVKKSIKGIRDRSLLMIPERFAIGMIEHGWILRNKIIWKKNNCMPQSAKNRFTVDYEYVFFFTRGPHYYFKTQYEPYSEATLKEFGQVYNGQGLKAYDDHGVQNPSDVKRRIISSLKGPPFGGTKLCPDNRTYSGNLWNPQHYGRNMRAVWTINTKPFKGAHFAVFPPALVERMIDAGCPEHICDNCGMKWTMGIIEHRVNTRPGVDVLNGKSGGPQDPNSALHKSDLSRYRQQIIRNEDRYYRCPCGAPTHGGIVLDPFAGSGTTCMVAKRMKRNWIGIELNRDYIDMARARLS